MNEQLIISAIEEMKSCRRELMVYYVLTGAERTQRMNDAICALNEIEKFEQTFEELRCKYNAMQSINKASGQPEEK